VTDKLRVRHRACDNEARARQNGAGGVSPWLARGCYFDSAANHQNDVADNCHPKRVRPNEGSPYKHRIAKER
jgi:hypothetical protein